MLSIASLWLKEKYDPGKIFFDCVTPVVYTDLNNRKKLMELKRDLTKYIRDKAKALYVKDSACRICGSSENLDFHHYNSVTTMLSNWVKKEKLDPEQVLEWRERFIEEHRVQMYDETVTLCHTHHLLLHSVYGKEPSLFTAKKQQRWVEIQRGKHGLVTEDNK